MKSPSACCSYSIFIKKQSIILFTLKMGLLEQQSTSFSQTFYWQKYWEIISVINKTSTHFRGVILSF
jgi:L-rhamnose mutarotase